MSPFKTVLGLAGGREALLLRWLPRPANKADLGIRIAVGMIITAARTAGILGSTLSDAVEQALVDVILAGAPAVQALPNEPQHVIHDLHGVTAMINDRRVRVQLGQQPNMKA